MAHVGRAQQHFPPAAISRPQQAFEGLFHAHTELQQQQQPAWAPASLAASPMAPWPSSRHRLSGCSSLSDGSGSGGGARCSMHQSHHHRFGPTSSRMLEQQQHLGLRASAAAEHSSHAMCGGGVESYEIRPSSDAGSCDGLSPPASGWDTMQQVPAKPQVRPELVRQVALKLVQAVLVADAAGPEPAAVLLQQQPAQLHALLQELQQPTAPQTPSKQEQAGGSRRRAPFNAFSPDQQHLSGAAAHSGELHIHSSSSTALLALDDDDDEGGAASLSGMPAACEVVSLSASSSHASAWSDEGATQAAHGSSAGSQAAAATQAAAARAPGQGVLHGLLVRLHELRTSIQRSGGRLHACELDRLSSLADEIATASSDVAAACGSDHPVSVQLTALQHGLEQWRAACDASMGPALAGRASVSSSNGGSVPDDGAGLDAEGSAAGLGQESSFQAWQQQAAGPSQQEEPLAACKQWEWQPGADAGAASTQEHGSGMGSETSGMPNLEGAHSSFGASYAERRRCFMQALKQSLKESLERIGASTAYERSEPEWQEW